MGHIGIVIGIFNGNRRWAAILVGGADISGAGRERKRENEGDEDAHDDSFDGIIMIGESANGAQNLRGDRGGREFRGAIDRKKRECEADAFEDEIPGGDVLRIFRPRIVRASS